MPDKPAFTRREFLHTGLGMMSTIATVPAFLSRSSLALAGAPGAVSSLPGVPQDRVLVVIQLSGGNDGLNAVVPFGFREYYDQRPTLAVAEKDVIKLDTRQGIGLHPSLAPLRDLMDDRLCAIQQGVGYPNPNRSHFASMDIWHSGDTLDGGGASRGLGWLGRALDAEQAADHQRGGDPNHLACISIGSEAPLAVQGARVKPVAFERAELFRWAARDLHPALSQAYDALHETPVGADAAGPLAFVQRTACDAQVASDKVRAAVGRDTETPFPRSDLGRQLQMVANMIRAELPTRVYYVAMGGFDTHANQANPHANLLGQMAEAVQAFYAELGRTGHRSRVVSLAFSEFGRRVRQNASGGTDHGCAGPVFLFGEPIATGLLGEHPSLRDLDGGDLVHQTDFRAVYAALLGGWMKMDAAAALGGAYKRAPIFRA